ncbi:acyloxyacyl hydrolase [uncultured Aquimarina sp.]|uniref:acyloxyacyl hydrolase n=1 Tax=uncultured Aquimarina sp. TaxID=575652 RepID=UPI00260278D7|nr:acyloxyacyl hydrolase [uncultured Aquimarina sp.]
MKKLYLILALLTCFFSYSQSSSDNLENNPQNRFRFIEIKSHFGAFLKSDNALGNSGILDNGYGGVTVKLGWQPTNPNGWASRYGYPSYGIGAYVGFLSDANVFGNPNAIYGFMNFPISGSHKRNVFSIEPSLGITYNLNPFDEDTNELNTSIGARAAVYFNIDLGFTYKFTRELDLLYGFDFTHFSNGSTFRPNRGLNLYGINLGMRYNYNAAQFKKDNDPYTNNVLPARFKRPLRAARDTTGGNYISVYVVGGVGQTDREIGTNTVFGTFSGVLDYEHQFNEVHTLTGGVDFFYDNRFRDVEASERTLIGVHAGYDFSFWKLAMKFQIGTYVSDDKGKGGYFMRPALRYNISKTFFAQIGLKTLDGGSADYIEYGFGFKPFKW